MYLNVVLPLALDRGFFYSPGQFDVQVGNLVVVDFNRKKIVGLVLSVVQEKSVDYTVKEILSVVPIDAFSRVYVDFLSWVAYYNFAKIGLVLRSAIVRDATYDSGYVLAEEQVGKFKLTPAMLRLIELINEYKCVTLDILHKAKIQKKTLQKLLDIAVIKPSREAKATVAITQDDLEKLNFNLSTEQNAVKEKICIEGFAVHLLDGITGSGKTAVYLSAVLDVLKRDVAGQIVIIFSEIALALYIFERIKTHFCGVLEVVEWHSELSPTQRGRNWIKVVKNQARIIVGARSAIFLPIPNLRMIIVDEEHDSSFKQDQGDFTYNARDVAIMRGKLSNIPVILSSATPSLESYYNVRKKGFIHLKLENRFGGAQLPDVKVVDMREAQKVSQHISQELYDELKRTLDAGMQSLLFLNKRGYASIVICSACGHKMKCPDCISWLVEHKWNNTLLCHLCAFRRPMVRECENCSSEKIVSFGPGVEKIAEEIKELFPAAKMVVMSSDTKLSENIKKIEKGDFDIIIGTQIISKGYDFPKLTLLAIVDSDVSMYVGDLRNSEKSFQVLQQAMGRVGRRKIHPGRVLLQSYSPGSVVVEALKNNDRQTFYEEELKMREAEEMPPFSRLIGIIVSGLVEGTVALYATKIAKVVALIREITVFGPCPAAIGMRRNRFRYRILLILPKGPRIHGVLGRALAQIDCKKGVSVQVDVDPLSFL